MPLLLTDVLVDWQEEEEGRIMDRSAMLTDPVGWAHVWVAHAVQEATGSLALHQRQFSGDL